ncbi:MAG: AbrB/MazE/SpoVT family DNA-binding domain-containing protein [Actinomycetia bacterium]|nr:AbrB/MazE/SpoVT family DNA-binding domain-containing protein [Actinomycetes bacterium]
MAIVTSKGQITLPKAVREALGLTTGSVVEFTIEEGRVVLRKAVPVDAFRRWRGVLRTTATGGTDQLLEELRGP